MKRKELLGWIELCGCMFMREGSNHTLYFNPSKSLVTTIPRHREIDEHLARKICKDLGIEFKKK